MSRDPGEVFQRETRYDRHRTTTAKAVPPPCPDLYKRYPGARRTPLTRPDGAGSGLFDVTAARRSVRSFSGAPLALDDLGAMLYASAGVTATQRGMAYRAAPSAGALYPVETYVIAHSVEGLQPGVYHHAVAEHALDQVAVGDLRQALAEAGGGQGVLSRAAAVFVWTAVVDRCRHKYRDRAWRYVYLDTGHVAAHVSLAAVALGLGSCQVGAFYDDDLAGLIGVDLDSEPPLYLTAVGTP